jgi:hypothetical protein
MQIHHWFVGPSFKPLRSWPLVYTQRVCVTNMLRWWASTDCQPRPISSHWTPVGRPPLIWGAKTSIWYPMFPPSLIFRQVRHHPIPWLNNGWNHGGNTIRSLSNHKEPQCSIHCSTSENVKTTGKVKFCQFFSTNSWFSIFAYYISISPRHIAPPTHSSARSNWRAWALIPGISWQPRTMLW